MPGNEVGDRIHNFFAQENLSEGQHHSEVVDGSRTGLGDYERAYRGQSSAVQHGMNYSHHFARSQSQNQQPTVNGYMHGNQVFHTRQNEANILGVDTDSDRCNLTSRSFSMLNAHLGSGPELRKKSSVRMDFNDGPINYDFLGGQRHMSSQPAMFQSLPRQQLGIDDMQLMQQQQLLLTQIQEMQRQQQHQKQQLQQQETRQLNSANQRSSFGKQAANHPPAMVNGVPIQDGSNYSWQPELMATNSSWSQRAASPTIQGSSSGLMFSPEQGQAPRLMGMIPQQVDQSLYGVPVSGSRFAPNQYSHVLMDKASIQQISGSSNSFSGNQYPGFPDHASMHDSTFTAKQGYQGENVAGSADSQGLNGRFNLENSQRMDARQRNGPRQDFHGRQDLAGPSETPQEKPLMQVGPSQNVAALDPTEVKILFGSDDNLWEAFGRSTNMGSGGYNNMLDGADHFGSFPSVQSGSWSALMQSAVAETSSTDVGTQEEWSGMTSRGSEPPSGDQTSPNANDGATQQSIWPDNRVQASSIPNARPFGISDDLNSNIGYNNLSRVDQSGISPSNEPSERLQSSSSQRFVQPFSAEGTKWLDRKLLEKPVSDGGHNCETGTPSSDAELNAKSISGSWTNQQNISSYNTRSQPSIRPNGRKFVDSVTSGAGIILKNQGNTNSLQASQSTERKNPMFEAMGYGAAMWKTDSVSNSLGFEYAKSNAGSPQVNREDSSSNVIALPEPSTGRANHESFQQIPNGNNIDIWKHADPTVNPKGRDFPGNYQPQMDKSHHTFESSGNNSLNNGPVETLHYPDIEENKTDNFCNVPHNSSTNVVRENAWLDTNDSLTLAGAKVKPSTAGRKPHGIRKFQYHPMGDVDIDVEPSYGTRHATGTQPTPAQISQGLKGQDHGGVGQSEFPANIARTSMGMDKDRFPGSQGETTGLDEMASENTLSGSAPSTSTSFDRAVHHYATGKIPPSQNMLELLHKVDLSRERGNLTSFSSSDCNQASEMHETKNPDGYVLPQQNHASASKGFGLQLAPPSQLSSIREHALSSQSSSHANNFLSSTHVTSEVGEKGHTWMASTSSVQGLPLSNETSQGELRNNVSGAFGQTSKNSQGGNFSAVFPYSRSHLRNRGMHDAGGLATTDQSVNAFFDRMSSRSKQMNESSERAQSSQSALASVPGMSGILQNGIASDVEMHRLSNSNQNNGKDNAPQFPVLESVPALQDSTVSGTSQENSSGKMSPKMWTRVSTQQHSFGSQPLKASHNMFKSNIQLNNDSETTSSGPHKLETHGVQMIGSVPSEPGAASVDSHGFTGKEQQANDLCLPDLPENDPGRKTMNVSEGAEAVANCVAGTSISNPTSTQREIEAFGRSLRPDNFLHQNYPLLHQMQGMRNAEFDPSNRSSKRFKGPDSSVGVQQVGPPGGQQFYAHNNLVRDESTVRASVPHGDSKMPSFSAKPTDLRGTNVCSEDVAAFGQNDSQNASNCNAVSARAEYSQISPQMAPSWFNQYGTFKNGQILPLPDAQKIVTMKTTELPFTIGMPSSSLHALGQVEQGNTVTAVASQHGLRGSTPLPLANENLSSAQLANLDAADVSMVVVRPNKRKNATAELVPWHKQIMHGLQMLQNISSAESCWARAANRLAEKVEDEAEVADDGPSMYRSKKRLVLTIQLMQLLFCPPMAPVLSADAISYYESVVHFLARSTVGDACSVLSCGGNDSSVPSSSGIRLLEKLNESERLSDQYFSKVVEDLISRARKLENNLLRLVKKASVLDLRVECQELEKYSVINRFAKFHNRSQADASEMSSSSDATLNTQKSCLQRYVTALPMPRNLPDRVQCLSL